MFLGHQKVEPLCTDVQMEQQSSFGISHHPTNINKEVWKQSSAVRREMTLAWCPTIPAAFHHVEERELLGGLNGEGGDGEGERGGRSGEAGDPLSLLPRWDRKQLSHLRTLIHPKERNTAFFSSLQSNLSPTISFRNILKIKTSEVVFNFSSIFGKMGRNQKAKHKREQTHWH